MINNKPAFIKTFSSVLKHLVQFIDAYYIYLEYKTQKLGIQDWKIQTIDNYLLWKINNNKNKKPLSNDGCWAQ